MVSTLQCWWIFHFLIGPAPSAAPVACLIGSGFNYYDSNAPVKDRGGSGCILQAFPLFYLECGSSVSLVSGFLQSWEIGFIITTTTTTITKAVCLIFGDSSCAIDFVFGFFGSSIKCNSYEFYNLPANNSSVFFVRDQL